MGAQDDGELVATVAEGGDGVLWLEFIAGDELCEVAALCAWCRRPGEQEEEKEGLRRCASAWGRRGGVSRKLGRAVLAVFEGRRRQFRGSPASNGGSLETRKGVA